MKFWKFFWKKKNFDRFFKITQELLDQYLKGRWNFKIQKKFHPKIEVLIKKYLNPRELLIHLHAFFKI